MNFLKKRKETIGIITSTAVAVAVLLFICQACMTSHRGRTDVPDTVIEISGRDFDDLPDDGRPGFGPTPYEFSLEEIGPSDVYLPNVTPSSTPAGSLAPSPTPAPTSRPAISCEGDKVRYKDNGNVITAEGDIRVTYKDMELTADRVTVYALRREAFAEGNVTLTQGDNSISSDKIRYDFIKEQGTLSPGDGYYDPWFGRAETVDVEGKEKVEFIEGQATTDDYDDPDYYLEAKKVTIYPDDKIVMHNAAIYVGSVPLFWLPYYRRSLKDDCRGSFIYPGYRNTWGFFLLTGYQWCAPGVWITPHLDYRYRRGLAYGLDGRFYVGDTGKGDWQTYYLQDEGYEDSDDDISTRERYLIEFNYRQSLFYRIQSYFSFHYLSDPTIRQDFFRSEYDSDSQPESYLYLNRRWDEISLSFKIRPRINDFYTITEKLPEAKLQVQEFQLGESDFYYQGENSATNFKKKYGGESSSRYESFRFDTYHQMSYNRKFFGWLNIYPAVSIRGDYYSRGPGDPVDYGSGVSAAVSSSPTPKPSPTPRPPDRRDFW
ncbi:MAG: hypothetical protein U9N73_03435, partial [Candidatus Auribacterota bacterium]|nr:hypothetical protein [Candidatus Auribacterota bacterium]